MISHAVDQDRGSVLDHAHARYLAGRERGALATIGSDGVPQVKPVGYRYDPASGVVDIRGHDLHRSAKFRNIAIHPQVAFTVDDVPDPHAGAAGVRFLELRGTAEQVQTDDPPPDGLGPWVIRIHPTRVVSYNIAGPGRFSGDLSEPVGDESRPVLGRGGAIADEGERAVVRQVGELQQGLDRGDAELYNRHFADDVMWGSPYGATVSDYGTLHAIHDRMFGAPDQAHSRYEIVRVLTPTPDVVLAQVRRDALDGSGKPIPSHADEARFAEMALYVLVRREGRWWLAAGQNTRVNVDAGQVRQ